MPVFRKRPVVIEARQFHGKSYGADGDIARWAGAAYDENGDGRLGWLEIPTLEGVMRANAGDWIIKGVNGEFYPCQPDVFEQTYEQVERSPSGMRIKYVNG